MKIDILTLFPKMFDGPFSESILKRAQEDEKIEIQIHNLRDWAKDKHKTVDLPPYGGGPGMVMRVDVIDRAVQDLKKRMDSEALATSGESVRLLAGEVSAKQAAGGSKKIQHSGGVSAGHSPESRLVVLLDTKGPIYNQGKAKELSKLEHLILIAGHYEGVDHRVHEYVADEVISIGEYVLTGGEIPVMVVVDSVARLLPGVLGNSESLKEESYSRITDLTNKPASATPREAVRPLTGESYATTPGEKSWQYPQYTRPEKYKGWEVPKVLLSGNHKEIEKWRKSQTV